MGIWNWFSTEKPKVEVLADAIWSDRQAKLAGIARETSELLAPGSDVAAVMLVGHFPDYDSAMGEIVKTIDDAPLKLINTPAPCLDSLPGSELAFEPGQSVIMIMPERHPIRSRDDAIVSYAEDIRCHCRIQFHLSLDDPVVQAIADLPQGAIEAKLRADSQQPQQDSVFSSRIADAQAQFQAAQQGDAGAYSAEDWIQRNCPSL